MSHDRDEDQFHLAEDGRSDYVPVVIARSMEEAERYRELLEEQDIPAIVGSAEDEAARKVRRGGSRRGAGRGLPVLVPDALLDEASEVIAALGEEDEFEPASETLEEDELADEEDEEELEVEDDELELEEEELEEDEEDEEEEEEIEEDELFEEEEEEDEDEEKDGK